MFKFKSDQWLRQNSYYGKTQIKAKINEVEEIITLDELFERFQNTYVQISEELEDETNEYDELINDESMDDTEYVEGIEEIDLSGKNVYVLDGNGDYVKINRCLKHKRNDVKIFLIRIRSIDFKETKSNGIIGVEQILVITEDHEVIMKTGTRKKLSSIKIGDHLKGEVSSSYQDMIVTEITEVDGEDFDNVYNISTSSGTFSNIYLTVIGY